MIDDACKKKNLSLLLFCLFARARLDPKVKREMLDLLERKGTRAGLVDQDYKDPRDNRYTNFDLTTHSIALSSFQSRGHEQSRIVASNLPQSLFFRCFFYSHKHAMYLNLPARCYLWVLQLLAIYNRGQKSFGHLICVLQLKSLKCTAILKCWKSWEIVCTSFQHWILGLFWVLGGWGLAGKNVFASGVCAKASKLQICSWM